MSVLARALARHLALAAVVCALATGCGGIEGGDGEWLEGDDLATSEDALLGTGAVVIANPVAAGQPTVTVVPQALAEALAVRLILQNRAPTSDLLVAGDSSPDPIPARGADETASTTDSECAKHSKTQAN